VQAFSNQEGAVFAKIYIKYWKFHMQVILVHLQPFWRNSLLKSVSQPKVVKNSWKASIWGFKVIQGHQCWHS